MRQIDSRVVRYLNAADGYLELGMPGHALTELERISDAGPLKPAVAFMTGLALKDQHRYEEAIVSLHSAATEIPAPHNRDAWRYLGDCYRTTGMDEMADIAEMFADDPGIPADWEEDVACHDDDAFVADEANDSTCYVASNNEWLDERLPVSFHLPKK